MDRVRVRRPPAALSLQDVTPERDLTEDPAYRPGLVTAARVRKRIHRVARRVEAAVARRARHRVRPDGRGERILVQPAFGNDRSAGRPDEIVQDGAEPEPAARLDHGPGPPAGDGTTALAKCASGLHQRAFANRVSAGWMTSSTSPYATASSGVMNRSRSMSFITCSSGWPEWREMISAIRRVISRISFAAI